MELVEAVQTKEEVQQVAELLEKHGNIDYSDIWKIGVNMALRISDLLLIEFAHFKNDKNGHWIKVKEGKTGKTRIIRLGASTMANIERRRELYPNDLYLFQAHSNRTKAMPKALDRSTVARKFQEIGQIMGIHLGTHSMRKSKGLMMRKNDVDIEKICLALNHSNPSVTMRYLGITASEVDEAIAQSDFEF